MGQGQASFQHQKTRNNLQNRGENDSVVRIISARKATRREEELYGGAF
jgi:uncharacterized DUF497 family protein